MQFGHDKEEYAIVLDFLPNGYPFDKSPSHLKTPIVQALGKKHFSLLELVPKKGIFLQPYADVYIGEGKRDHIHHINGKIPVSKLTGTAKSEMEHAITSLVKQRESEFVEFFNTAMPLTTRMHALELLPGLGKKHMWAILDERKEPFKSFEDIKQRVKLMPDPLKTFVKRIIEELENESEKHFLFVDR